MKLFWKGKEMRPFHLLLDKKENSVVKAFLVLIALFANVKVLIWHFPKEIYIWLYIYKYRQEVLLFSWKQNSCCFPARLFSFRTPKFPSCCFTGKDLVIPHRNGMLQVSPVQHWHNSGYSSIFIDLQLLHACFTQYHEKYIIVFHLSQSVFSLLHFICFQGFFMFLFHCLLNSEVRNRTALTKLALPNSSNVSTKKENTFSITCYATGLFFPFN